MTSRGIADAIADERVALAATLEDIGAAASTLIPGWSAADIAAHVVSLDRAWGVPTFVGRTIVARGAVRLNDVAGRFADRAIRSYRRRGFAWAIERLRQPPPALLTRPAVAPVGLFEVTVHHEDVRRANELPPRPVPSDLLEGAIGWLLRYHRTRLPVTLHVRGGGLDIRAGQGPCVVLEGAPLEVLVWLAGRRGHADIAIDGEEGDVAALTAAALVV